MRSAPATTDRLVLCDVTLDNDPATRCTLSIAWDDGFTLSADNPDRFIANLGTVDEVLRLLLESRLYRIHRLVDRHGVVYAVETWKIRVLAAFMRLKLESIANG